MRFALLIAVLIALLSACGDSDKLKQELEALRHPSEVQVTDVRTADGILGRAETVTSFRVQSSYKAASLPMAYEKALRGAGWNICSDPSPTRWIEFMDSSSGVEKTRSQLTIRFSKNNFDGEVRIEQDDPRTGADQRVAGIGYMRITTPASLSCAGT